jgi:hypothetical protein
VHRLASTVLLVQLLGRRLPSKPAHNANKFQIAFPMVMDRSYT